MIKELVDVIIHNPIQFMKPILVVVISVVEFTGVVSFIPDTLKDNVVLAFKSIINFIFEIITKILLLLNNIFNFTTNINIIKWSKFLGFIFINRRCINVDKTL